MARQTLLSRLGFAFVGVFLAIGFDALLIYLLALRDGGDGMRTLALTELLLPTGAIAGALFGRALWRRMG